MTSPRASFLFFVCLGAALGAADSAFAQAVARADVDRNCTVTAADANIVKAQLGKKTGQAGFNPNADVDQNGVVNNIDVTFVARNVGKNVCAPPPPPPAAPTIVATVAPPANANGWHRTAATVTFACTNAVSCPAPVTISTEGANQVVARTVANSAGATASASVTLNLDVTPPVLVVTTPAAVAPGAAVAIPVSATDLSGLATSTLLLGRAAVDTKTAAPFTLAWTAGAVEAGTQLAFEIVGEDRAGNVAAVRRPFSVERPDATPPSVSIGAPATAGPGATVPLTVRASDLVGAIARVRVTQVVSGVPTVVEDRTTGPFAFQTLGQIPAGASAGEVVSFAAVATDASGNTAAASADVQVVTSVTTQTLQITVDPPVSPTFQTSGVITGTIGRGTAVVPPPATPLVAGLSPTSGGQGQTVDVTITGVNTTFGPLTQVTFGSGVTVQSLTATTPGSLVARIAIAAGAGLGPRVVAVSTGTQEAILPDGFAIVSGAGTVTGRVVTAASQAIANAQICVATGAPCVASSGTGAFSFGSVPSDLKRLVVSATGYDAQSVAVALTPNGNSSVGDVILTPTNQPPPPPLPNSPPVTPALATVLGRGATELLPSGSPDQLRAVVRDAILAVGGREIGVLDASGQQLNAKMVGAGYASLTDAAVDDIASEMVFGDTMPLSTLLYILSGSITLPAGVTPPTLGQLLTALQQQVNLAWQNPSAPESPLVMLLFNKGRVASATPPRVSFDTELNALQVNMMTVAYMAFVTRYLPEGAAPPYASLTPPAGTDGPGLWARAKGLVASLVPRLAPPSLTVSGLGPRWTGDRQLARLGRPQTPAFQGGVFGQTGDLPGSTYWADVYKQVLPATSWDAAKKFGGLCDKYIVQTVTVAGAQSYPGGSVEAALAAKDPNAAFLPAPECKTVIDLFSVLATSGSKGYETAAKSMKGYFAGVGATRDMGKAVEVWYTNADHQAAWNAAKAEARQTQLTQGLAKIGVGLVEGALSKVQGAIIDKVLAFEANMVIASVRPRQPFIRKVEQMIDPTVTPPAPSHIVKVWFDRSPNDKVQYDDPAIQWRYRLYRGKRNSFSPVAMKVFKKDDELSFSDWVPGDDTYSYVVVGVRQIGVAIDDPPPPNALLGFLSGFFDTTVKIGAEGAKRAVFGMGVITTITTPMTQILKGVRYQVSDASKPETIYVSTSPPTPKPPASLAVWGATGISYVSVPVLNSIFSVVNGKVSLYAVPNFKAPGAVGLGITGNGTLLTDNAASDAQFGGRVFSFAPTTGARAIAGTVNYFSQLLMFANPVSVQSMVVASGPFGTNLSNIHEESLFIADSQSQRITRMPVPTSLPPGVTTDRNVSQPWVTSPLFNFGPDTAMAMSSNYRMAITQGDNLLLTSPAGPFAPPSSVQQLFNAGSGAPSPYQRLSGVTFDGYANIYVSDSSLGTLSMIPATNALPNNGLFGLSVVDRKKLIIEKGLLRPIDVKVNSARDGLVYFDAERILGETRFGMSGQVVSDTGTPLAGAIVHVPLTRRIAVTDSDGVFVMPDLVQLGTSPVVDFTVQYLGDTRSFSRVLDIFRHNVTDVTFGPAPPIPPDVPVPPPPPPPPPQKQTTSDGETTPVTIAVSFDLDPAAPPPPPLSTISGSCPRGVILSPGFDTATTSGTISVTGLVSNRWAFGTATVPAAFLVVNGVANAVTLSGLEFSTSAILGRGNNTLAIALPAGVLKPIGCAPATAADTDPITISADHRVFHDPTPTLVADFRRAAGWDLATRAIVRTGGVPLAGVDFVVPGTSLQATTDGDGVMQINISKTLMAGATTSADQLAAGIFNDVGRAVGFIRADQAAPSIAALKGLIATAVSAAAAPPPAATTSAAVVTNLVQVQAAAMRLLASLEALQVPNPADIAALESAGLQFASTTSNGEIVMTARDYPGLTLTVKVQ